jgi:hypothetical protein
MAWTRLGGGGESSKHEIKNSYCIYKKYASLHLKNYMKNYNYILMMASFSNAIGASDTCFITRDANLNTVAL